MRLIRYPAILGLAALLSAPAALAGDVVDIGSRRELFVDRLLIDRLVGASLRLGTPLPGGVAVRFNDPVEDDTAFYTTIFKDGDLYRMYYRGALFERKTTCYAESRDGINWTKPDLGLVSIDGSTRNHVILPEARQFVAFIDGRPGVPASERYKGTSRGSVEPNALVGFLLRRRHPLAGCSGRAYRTQSPDQPLRLAERHVLVGGGRAVRALRPAHGGGAPRHGAGHLQGLHQLDSPGPHELQRHRHDGFPRTISTRTRPSPYFRAPHIYISLPARIIFADPRHIKREEDKDLARRRQRVITPRAPGLRGRRTCP